jgi:type II secretory pathway component PulF
MNAEDLVALNEEIAGMARAGLPLDQGLAALAREMGRGRLRRVTSTLAEDLRAGHTLPEALRRQGSNVPPYYASLVAAGVRGGNVHTVLATLTTYARTVTGLRTTVIEAFFYPAVVLVFAAAIAALLCVFVLPQFAEIFHDFNMQLPALTRGFLAVGQHPGRYLGWPLAILCGGILLLRFGLRRTARGRRLWARLVYGVPVAGTLIRSARLAAFTDLLALLVDQQIPLPEALRLAGDASADPVMADAARAVHDELVQGRPLGEAMRGRGLVPEWIAWMAGLGEQRGQLGQSLHHIAATYRRQVELRAALLRSVLPPFVVIVLAGTIATFMICVLVLPMLRLLEGLSK